MILKVFELNVTDSGGGLVPQPLGSNFPGWRSCRGVKTQGFPMVFQGLPRGRLIPDASGSLPPRLGSNPRMRKSHVFQWFSRFWPHVTDSGAALAGQIAISVTFTTVFQRFPKSAFGRADLLPDRLEMQALSMLYVLYSART